MYSFGISYTGIYQPFNMETIYMAKNQGPKKSGKPMPPVPAAPAKTGGKKKKGC